jgi:hypothetical protein
MNHVPRVRTDDAAFLAGVKARADHIRGSLARIDMILQNAGMVPRDFIDSLDKALNAAEDACDRAGHLATAKVHT